MNQDSNQAINQEQSHPSVIPDTTTTMNLNTSTAPILNPIPSGVNISPQQLLFLQQQYQQQQQQQGGVQTVPPHVLAALYSNPQAMMILQHQFLMQARARQELAQRIAMSNQNTTKANAPATGNKKQTKTQRSRKRNSNNNNNNSNTQSVVHQQPDDDLSREERAAMLLKRKKRRLLDMGLLPPEHSPYHKNGKIAENQVLLALCTSSNEWKEAVDKAMTMITTSATR